MTDASGWPDFLASPGAFAASLAAAAPHSRSFLKDDVHPQDFPRWAAETRARFVDLLHYAPPTVDPTPEVIARHDYPDLRRETLLLPTAPWSRVTCDVLVPHHPRDGRWPAPAIVGLHCHGGAFRWGREKIVEAPDPETENPVLRRYRQQLYGGRGYANELARRGYVVAVIDAFYFGDRRLRYTHRDWPEAYREAEASLEPESEAWLALLNRAHQETMPRVAGALFQAGGTWPGVFVCDDRRTIDYLQSRDDVDADRIGCVGLSVGGYRSALLTAADERIKAAVTVGWMCGLGELWPIGRWMHSAGWVHYVPGMYQELDLPDVASLACPRALLVQQGRQDRLFPPDGQQRALDHVGAAYAKAGFPDRFAGRMYDVPHQFNLEMQADAFAWLDRWL
ncbi:MAG TPA: alpha/beta hydrolase family protein [Chloroflexota bacterium]|nr:alpha/beta hydrolase family protein [Chloroflexota bacterium]